MKRYLIAALACASVSQAYGMSDSIRLKFGVEDRSIDRALVSDIVFFTQDSPITINTAKLPANVWDRYINPYFESGADLNLQDPAIQQAVDYLGIKPKTKSTASSKLSAALQALRDALDALSQSLQKGAVKEYTIQFIELNRPKFTKTVKSVALSGYLQGEVNQGASPLRIDIDQIPLTSDLWDHVIAPALSDKNFSIPQSYKTDTALDLIIDVTKKYTGLEMEDLHAQAESFRYPKLILKNKKVVPVHDIYKRSAIFANKKVGFVLSSQIDEKTWNVIQEVFSMRTPEDISKRSGIKDTIDQARAALKELGVSEEPWIPAPSLFVEAATLPVDVAQEAKNVGYDSVYPSLIKAIAVDQTGQKMGAFFRGGLLKIWDMSNAKNPQLMSTITYQKNDTNDTNIAQGAAFSADFKTVALGTKYRTVQIFDISNPSKPQFVKEIGQTSRGQMFSEPTSSTLAFSPDGKFLAFGGYGSGLIEIYFMDDLDKLPVTANLISDKQDALGANSSIKSLLFTSSSDGLYVGASSKSNSTGGVTYYEFNNNTIDKNAGTVVPIGSDYITLAGDYLAGRDVYGATVLKDRALFFTYDNQGDRQQSVALAHDGGLLALGTENGHVRLWDISSGVKDSIKQLTMLEKQHTPRYEFRALAFSGDGKTLVSGADGSIVVWKKTK